MANYSLDSSIVIEILRQNPVVIRRLEETKNTDKHYICSIVYYEIMRGFNCENHTRKINAFQTLYENVGHLFFDRENFKVIYEASKIYRKLKSTGSMIDENDIYIAAISMVNDCTLVTANTRHFERVEGLNFVNWRD